MEGKASMNVEVEQSLCVVVVKFLSTEEELLLVNRDCRCAFQRMAQLLNCLLILDPQLNNPGRLAALLDDNVYLISKGGNCLLPTVRSCLWC